MKAKKSDSINNEIEIKLPILNEEQPWCDSHGKLLPPEELREIAKTWGGSTWEAYLQSFEQTQPDELFYFDNPEDIDNVDAEKYTKAILELTATGLYPKIRKTVRAGLKTLSNRERQVIQLMFWKSMNVYDIARNLKLSRATVRVLLNRALQKIHTHLIQNRVNL